MLVGLNQAKEDSFRKFIYNQPQITIENHKIRILRSLCSKVLPKARLILWLEFAQMLIKLVFAACQQAFKEQTGFCVGASIYRQFRRNLLVRV